jgi:hypothetical protein
MLIFKWWLDMIPRQRLPARWHEELIHAISANNTETAESAMRIHIRHGLDDVMKTIEHLSEGMPVQNCGAICGQEPAAALTVLDAPSIPPGTHVL